MRQMTDMPITCSADELIACTEGGHGACAGCGLALSLRLFTKAMGTEMIMVIPPGCTPVTLMRPRFNAAFGVFVALFGSTAVFAAGLKAGLQMRNEADTHVVAWGGDGATFDIGLQVLSGAAERNDDIIYVCCDNEAYQNTGNQRSSATPYAGHTSTNPLAALKAERKKDIMQIMAAHQIPYAATASAAYPDDLMQKVHKAKTRKGFRFLHLLAPGPTGWRFFPERTVEVARLAVKAGVFPLYEVESGRHYTLNSAAPSVPAADYLNAQGRFQHLTSEQIDTIQQSLTTTWQRLKWLTTYPSSDHREEP